MMQVQSKKIIHIELLRVICIFLVMFNHTGNRGFFLFSIAQDSPLYWFYMFISIMDKVAVPVFFMISGALLLGRDEDIKTVYTKRVLKFAVILLASSFLYHVYNWYFNGADFDIAAFFKTVYSKNAATALWFLYSYIALLIMLPVLRMTVKNMASNIYIYICICQLLFVGMIPIAQYCLSLGSISLNGNLNPVLFTSSNIFYFLMGYFFENVLDKKYYTAKNAVILISISIIMISVSCLMTQYKADVTGELAEGNSQTFHNSLIAVPSFTLYFIAKLLFMKVKASQKLEKLIRFVGGTTFGIFLLEGMLRERTVSVYYALLPKIHSLPACLVWTLCAFTLGVVIVALLKRIPIVRKYI